MKNNLDLLKNTLSGDLLIDHTSRVMYATDASAYRELPLAIALPKNSKDIQTLIQFANKHNIGLIPRTTGTSLAGQVVGSGIIVDVSKYMTSIVELNSKEKWVRVEPGVNLDELNQYLLEYKLFFAPETSTSKSCRIGGMVGNNAAGSHSLVYHTTREHIISIKAILSDGSEVKFKSVTNDEFYNKCKGNSLENKIYQQINEIFSDADNCKEIRDKYPAPNIIRRNTGYALDSLLNSELFSNDPIYNLPYPRKFNFSKLIAGSEGTLAFITEIKLTLTPLPPAHKGLICAHFNTVKDAIKGNLVALQHQPAAIELMDKTILDCAKQNISQLQNRFFINGDPGAILIIEIAESSNETLQKKYNEILKSFLNSKLGYSFPLVTGNDINRVWGLRKAGLGVLSNLPGDAKPVSVVEDTSIPVGRLEEFIDDFNKLLVEKGLSSVYHAHISVGELHLRPILNLKENSDREIFRYLAEKMAYLVKKYHGSLSGEHGDGRLRSEFIPIVLGEKNFELIKQIKNLWDPKSIFNPGKIIDSPKMDTFFRYEKPSKRIESFFSYEGGILRAVEKCSGVGDCRKSHLIGGTMCPSYMATKDEFSTTRARANVFRDFLIHSPLNNPFNHKEIFEILDLCLSCKGCKSECPSNVDMAKLKSEFLYQYYKKQNRPLSHLLLKKYNYMNRIFSNFPCLYNNLLYNTLTSKILKWLLGFASKRSLPFLSNPTLWKWIQENLKPMNQAIQDQLGIIYLFIDEITNYNESHIGIKTIILFTSLGYKVKVVPHAYSGRMEISKGLLKQAKYFANNNVATFSQIITSETPLIGIEPSAILSFRDEYQDLVDENLKQSAKELSKNVFTVEEFISQQFENNKLSSNLFTDKSQKILLHGHCQQKSISNVNKTITMLSIPTNHQVEEIPSGCCGMAGLFGYEKKHYDLSMMIGELILFPTIRKTDRSTIISAPGTSCRQQIFHGTGIKAFHPVEILYSALKKTS